MNYQISNVKNKIISLNVAQILAKFSWVGLGSAATFSYVIVNDGGSVAMAATPALCGLIAVSIGQIGVWIANTKLDEAITELEESLTNGN